jgi:hypothetical protein
MAGDQKNSSKEFRSFCQGMPFAEMMQKMTHGHGMGSFCAEMMEKVKGQQENGCRFDCAEMMRTMMTKCGRSQNKREGDAKDPSGT